MRVVYIPAALVKALALMGVERSNWGNLPVLAGKLSREDLALYIYANTTGAATTLAEPIRASFPNALAEQLETFYTQHWPVRDAVTDLETGEPPALAAFDTVNHESAWLDRDTLYISEYEPGRNDEVTPFSTAQFYAGLIGQANTHLRLPQIAVLPVFTEYLRRTCAYFQAG